MDRKCKEYETRIDKLEEKLDLVEQHSRRKNLRIYGVDEVPNENTVEVVISVLEKMQVEVPKVEIVAFRVGKKNGNDSRPIYVKLRKEECKVAAMKKRKALKGTGIVLVEDLTPKRLQILKSAKEKYGLRAVWTIDGNIYANVNNVKTRINIYSSNNTGNVLDTA